MSSVYWPYLFGDYYHGLEIVSAIVSVLIMLSSLDDLFVDLWYWVRKFYRALTIQRRCTPLQAWQLRAVEEQPLAIMVPAWREYDVIAAMLESMIGTLEYKNYMIFVGTYQNDERTIQEVERMRRRYRQLVRVEVPHDGPTCKADCLNWIVQAIFRQNRLQPTVFAGLILHDSEDVLHPLELKYYNYLLPRIDFIQLPVTSLEREWYELVAGTYMDEFAEWHTKDLAVRESLSKMVPSAGVGTCFSCRAITELAAETDNQPFNTDTLTEDYDIGARLARRGMKQIFGTFPVEYRARRKGLFGIGRDKVITLSMPLGIREYFPNTFHTAYRQKARWTLGIGLQGWAQVGWAGSFAVKYLLFRDRKGLVTSFIAVLAYFMLVNFLLFFFADLYGEWRVYFPPLFPPHGWLVTLMSCNALMLLLRVIQRSYFVYRIYGWGHGLLAIPRMVIGNFINMMAAARAWRLFLVHLLTGRRLVWDKTMHDFPSTDQLMPPRRRLGELMLSWQVIDETQLTFALAVQAKNRKPIGKVLIEQGWLDEATLHEALSFQRESQEAAPQMAFDKSCAST